MIELRDYQKAAVEAGLKHLKKKNPKPGIIVAPTAMGKSLLISNLAVRLGEPVLVLQPSKEILLQNYEKAKAFGAEPTIWSASCNTKELGPLTYATLGSVKKMAEDFKSIGVRTVLVDECFTGETEILTEKGFVRFDNLPKNIKVAQYNPDDETISFANPIRHIEKFYQGNLIELKIYRDIWMPVTENHEFLYKSPRTGKFNKRTIKDMKFGYQTEIPACGKSSFDDNGILTPLERLYIAVQAYGCIQGKYHDHTNVYFSFSKQRKIDRLFLLCKQAEVYINEIKAGHLKKRRFVVKMPADTTKDIRNHIQFPMSWMKAQEIMAECYEWDGSKNISGRNINYYSSTKESQTDFFQAVGILAGYSSYKAIQTDNRKDIYNNVYRLYVNKKKKFHGTQAYKKRLLNYNGKVYCVEVESGNIVVRHKGVVLITGNCHAKYPADPESMFMKFLKGIPDARVLGFTATPCRLHQYTSLAEGNYSKLNMLMYDQPSFFKEIIHVCQVKELVDKGYWAKLKYEVWDFDTTGLVLNSAGSEYTEKSVTECIQRNGLNNTLYMRLLSLWNERKHILVCMDTVKNCHVMSEFINKKKGAEVTAVVEANTPKKEREEIIEKFKEGKLKAVFNHSTLAIGFDFPELDCVMFGRPTFSFSTYYQLLGRAVRPSSKKKDALIVDCCNNYARFGRVEDISIENVPYKGWCIFSGNKLISGIRLGLDVTRKQIMEIAERKAALMQNKKNIKEIRITNTGRKKLGIRYECITFPFGKYKGDPLWNTPMDYLKWVAENIPGRGEFMRKLNEYYSEAKQYRAATS